MRIYDKTFIVTGSNSSIGQELIAILLSRSCRVIAVDLKEPVLSSQYENNDLLTVITADITAIKSVKMLYGKVFSIYDKIDGIINNAGIIQPLPNLSDMKFEEIEHIFNINYHGTLYMAKTFLPHLLSRPEAHFVVSNVMSQRSAHKISQIRSSIKILTEGLHSELLDTNVKVMSVFSGIIENPEEPMFSVMTSSKAAMEIIKGMEQNNIRIDIVEKVKYNFSGSDEIIKNIKRKIKTLHRHLSSKLNDKFRETLNN